MTRVFLASLLVLLAFPALAINNNGFYKNSINCNGDLDNDSVIQVNPKDKASWCPVSATSVVIRVVNLASLNWDGDPTQVGTPGSVVLAVYKCSGIVAASCDTPVVDSAGVPWSMVSDTKDANGHLDSGYYRIVASGITATGLLLVTGY